MDPGGADVGGGGHVFDSSAGLDAFDDQLANAPRFAFGDLLGVAMLHRRGPELIGQSLGDLNGILSHFRAFPYIRTCATRVAG